MSRDTKTTTQLQCPSFSTEFVDEKALSKKKKIEIPEPQICSCSSLLPAGGNQLIGRRPRPRCAITSPLFARRFSHAPAGTIYCYHHLPDPRGCCPYGTEEVTARECPKTQIPKYPNQCLGAPGVGKKIQQHVGGPKSRSLDQSSWGFLDGCDPVINDSSLAGHYHHDSTFQDVTKLPLMRSRSLQVPKHQRTLVVSISTSAYFTSTYSFGHEVVRRGTRLLKSTKQLTTTSRQHDAELQPANSNLAFQN